jgi:hypothetical protein
VDTPEVLEISSETSGVETSIQSDRDLFGRSGKVIGKTLDRSEINVVVHLSELRTISSINSKSTFWWSVATFIFGAGLALFLTGLTIDHRTSGQIALTLYAPMVCGVFAFFSLIAAMREAAHWKSELFKVERESGLPALTWPVRFRRWWHGRGDV